MGGKILKAPSLKQIEFANDIAESLCIDFPRTDYDFTAYAYWNFINAHVQEYNKKLYAYNFENNLDHEVLWGYELGLWDF